MDGHIKLTDFGLSKEKVGKSFLSYSFCGSPEYMSPEMLTKEGHNLAIDIYSLGALLYEMLTGLPPHYSRNRQQMYHQILNNSLTFPPYLSEIVIDLLDLLLRKDPNERISISEVKAHKYLIGVNWKEMQERNISPPEALDFRTSHFDPEYTSMKMSWTESGELPEDNPRSHSLYEVHPENKKILPQECETTMFAIETPELNWDIPTEMAKSIIGNKKKKSRECKHPNKLDYYRGKSNDNQFNGNPFSGYEFSREKKKKKGAGKKQPEGYKKKVDLVKKTFSIQAAYVRGESNEPDIVVPNSDEENSEENESNTIEEDEREPRSRVSLTTKQRCVSSENNKNIHKSTTIIQGIPQTCIKINWPNKTKPKEAKYVQVQELPQYETCNLINGQESKISANIIQLNDDQNGVISERKRWQLKKKDGINNEIPTKEIFGKKISGKPPIKQGKIANPRKLNANDDNSGWTADTQITNNEGNFGLASGYMTRKISSSNQAHSSGKNSVIGKEEVKANFQHQVKTVAASSSLIKSKGANWRKSRQLYFSPGVKAPATVRV